MKEKEADVIVVGGGPAGVISAVTARRYYPDKKILVIKSVGRGVIPCGIPYMFATLEKPEDNAMSDLPLEKSNVELLVDEVTAVNRQGKTVSTKSGRELAYDKLVLAHGSEPVVPPVKGIEKKGVYPIYKDLDYLKAMKEEIRKAKSVLIIGGGFIGVEFADELAGLKGLKVYLVELLPGLLANSFDAEFGQMALAKLKAKGVEVICGEKVEELTGGDQVTGVLLSDGTRRPVEAVVLGIGARPNVKLAEAAGIDLGRGQGIWTDEYMRTSDPDIFAVGDCAGKRDFFTRKSLPVMLASTATAEARIAGANLFQLKVVRENKGTIAIYSTYVNGLVLGSAGLNEATAGKEGFDYIAGEAEAPDKHPGGIPGMVKMRVKLVFSRQSEILLGGQVSGGMSAGEVINIIGMALQKRVSATELETLQIATHPCLTAAPTMYPLVLAAQDAAGKI
ncbi:MAG: FAD-dependent oxidoreductase [Candidatus Saganbacteria bacterium]|nr:FAD-dependent oxidoreductase [Candidatus Saganbacteria bacterium]